MFQAGTWVFALKKLSTGSCVRNIVKYSVKENYSIVADTIRILLFLKGPKVQAFPVRGQRGGRMKGEGSAAS
jgi:hypothetical protein